MKFLEEISLIAFSIILGAFLCFQALPWFFKTLGSLIAQNVLNK